MKRLITIGSGLFIYSFIPILSWLILALVLNDSRISNVFSITYALQFIWSILTIFFGSGANIRKQKEKNTDAVWNGIFWGTIITIIVFGLLIVFSKNYISFFGQDVEFYNIYVKYSMCLMLIQTLFSYIIEKLYFEDREKFANINMIIFNSLNFVLLIILSLIIPKTWIALMITLIVLAIYVIYLYIREFEKFKIRFDFFKNFKYESSRMVSAIFMLLMYLFGYKNAFTAGAEYLAALNLAALCTDTQWDSLKAIGIVAKVDISKKRYNYISEFKKAYYYTLIMIATSVIMVFALFKLYDVALNLVLIYLLLQIVDMLMDPQKEILSVYTQLEYSPTLNTIINFSSLVLRFIMAITIMSPYCNEIAQTTQGIVTFISYLILRFTQYKINNNMLVNKKNKDYKNS